MAQQLWLLRHAEAEPHGARNDDERRLTARGEEQSRVAGRALAGLEITFQHVFTSPKVRARDTALAACEAFGLTPVDHVALRQGFDGRDARELLGSVGADERILVVGHEPDFSQVVQDLTGARVEFKKGGVAGLRVGSTSAELLALLRPRELARLG